MIFRRFACASDVRTFGQRDEKACINVFFRAQRRNGVVRNAKDDLLYLHLDELLCHLVISSVIASDHGTVKDTYAHHQDGHPGPFPEGRLNLEVENCINYLTFLTHECLTLRHQGTDCPRQFGLRRVAPDVAGKCASCRRANVFSSTEYVRMEWRMSCKCGEYRISRRNI